MVRIQEARGSTPLSSTIYLRHYLLLGDNASFIAANDALYFYSHSCVVAASYNKLMVRDRNPLNTFQIPWGDQSYIEDYVSNKGKQYSIVKVLY